MAKGTKSKKKMKLNIFFNEKKIIKKMSDTYLQNISSRASDDMKRRLCELYRLYKNNVYEYNPDIWDKMSDLAITLYMIGIMAHANRNILDREEYELFHEKMIWVMDKHDEKKAN